ncbi:MAG: GrpB family protein [Actinomycetota bacterium]|nr:GrpB family protein [Actinomycetota bacterium]
MNRSRGTPDRRVEVVAYDPTWPVRAAEECHLLVSRLGDVLKVVEHVGSTAVAGLPAKPTLDLLAGTNSIPAVLERVEELEGLGYEYRPASFVTSPDHLFFRKVRNRKRTHHLHVVYMGTAEFQEYLWFRDFLVANPEAAQRYAAFKLELAVECANDRNGYVEKKAEFVAPLMDEVRAWAASRE